MTVKGFYIILPLVRQLANGGFLLFFLFFILLSCDNETTPLTCDYEFNPQDTLTVQFTDQGEILPDEFLIIEEAMFVHHSEQKGSYTADSAYLLPATNFLIFDIGEKQEYRKMGKIQMGTTLIRAIKKHPKLSHIHVIASPETLVNGKFKLTSSSPISIKSPKGYKMLINNELVCQ